MIAAGRLNKFIELHQATKARNDDGEVAETFTLQATVPAEVIQNTAREAVRNDNVSAQHDYTILIRTYAGLSEDWKIVYGTKTLYVKGVSVLNNEPFMTILASEDA